MAQPTTNSSHAIGMPSGVPLIVPFEKLLSQNLEFAMTEGSYFLEGRGAVHETLQRLTKKLDELGIAYAIAGGMALYVHGYRRFTDDIDLLVTRDGLKVLHQSLDGLGYVRPFEKSKNLRDVKSKVKIEFLLTGDYPGDGKPKPVAFPNPADAVEVIEGLRVLSLPALVELKLASGISNVERAKDIADVVELIKLLRLPRELSDKLNPFVRGKYLETWDQLNQVTRRYELRWRNKWLTAQASSMDEMVARLRQAADELESMLADGVRLDLDEGAADDYVRLVTEDPQVAEKYGMQPEEDFFEDDKLDQDEN